MKLKDYLATRRVEIEGEMKALKGELAEIRIAEEALSGAPTNKTVVRSPRGRSVVREGSIKDWVLKALMTFGIGLETEDVIAAVQNIGGPAVVRNSMTPQLSRLKADGLISLDGGKWSLVQPNLGPNNETPGVSPPDVPEDEGFLDLA